MTPSNPPSRPHVRVTTGVRERLGNAGFSRTGMVRALTIIHVSLAALASQVRNDNRLPAPAIGFHYNHSILDEGRIRRIRLTVGDAGWLDEIWVSDITIADTGPLQ